MASTNEVVVLVDSHQPGDKKLEPATGQTHSLTCFACVDLVRSGPGRGSGLGTLNVTGRRVRIRMHGRSPSGPLLSDACSYKLFPARKRHYGPEIFHVMGPVEIKPEPGKASRRRILRPRRRCRLSHWDHKMVGNVMDIIDAYDSRLGQEKSKISPY